MKGHNLVAFLFLACSYCYGLSDIRLTELKEEEFSRKGQIEQFVKEIGKDQTLIYPGGPPVHGFEAVVKYIKGIRAKGLAWYNSTVIEEMDLGVYALQLMTFMSYCEHGTMCDTGTEMKFYKKGNGKLSLLVDAGVSLRTPWPVKTASAREYDATVK